MAPIHRHLIFFLTFLPLLLASTTTSTSYTPPTPSPWPPQFHALLFVNYSGALSTIDLWYDWPNGRNLNLIRDQLSPESEAVHDVEWNNGTSFVYTASGSCKTLDVGVGILRLDWLRGANYLGRELVDGFTCNVFEKEKFIWYYEDVVSKRPVHWIFYTGRSIHVMRYEVGAALEDEKWQAPPYCFDNGNSAQKEFSARSLDIQTEFTFLRNSSGLFSA